MHANLSLFNAPVLGFALYSKNKTGSGPTWTEWERVSDTPEIDKDTSLQVFTKGMRHTIRSSVIIENFLNCLFAFVPSDTNSIVIDRNTMRDYSIRIVLSGTGPMTVKVSSKPGYSAKISNMVFLKYANFQVRVGEPAEVTEDVATESVITADEVLDEEPSASGTVH